MKKLLAIFLCAAAVLSLASCAGKSAESESSQIANPFVDCETMEDAAKIAGFEMTVPDKIDGYPDKTIQAIEGDMIQAIYSNGDNDVILRKAAESGDISGDYNDYAETDSAVIGTAEITMKGNEGKVNVATWTDGGFAYAVDIGGDGLSKEDVTALAGEMG